MSKVIRIATAIVLAVLVLLLLRTLFLMAVGSFAGLVVALFFFGALLWFVFLRGRATSA